jgi:hypothetical protein
VYVVLSASGLEGSSVAVWPERVTIPATEPPPGPSRVNVPVFTVVAWTSSEKVAVTFPVGLTPVAPPAGVTTPTVGAVVSGAGCVVNSQVKLDAR